MPYTSKHHDPLLRTIRQLGLADLEMLSALCAAPGFSPRGVRWALDKFRNEGLVYRLWKHRDPKFRMDRGSARQVFLLAPKGAEWLGAPASESKAHEMRFKWLSNPRTEYRLDHELMIARCHASLLVAEKHHPEALRLVAWEQGEGTAIHGDGYRISPDAVFRLTSDATKKAGWFYLEADTGNERLESDDETRRTIIKKIRRYGQADRDGAADAPKFSVLFLVPRRSDPDRLSGREAGVLDIIRAGGRLHEHGERFYRVMSETEVLAALAAPSRFFTTPVVRHWKAEQLVAETLVPMPPALHAESSASYAEIAGR